MDVAARKAILSIPQERLAVAKAAEVELDSLETIERLQRGA